MRVLVLWIALLAPIMALSAGCEGENRNAKPKAGVVDTSDPSKIVIPDQMKKGTTPAQPAAPKR